MDYKNSKPVKQAKKGLFHMLFSRVTIVLVLMILQMVSFYAMVTYFQEYEVYIRAVLMILEIVSVLSIINSGSNPAFKITWILVILVLPFFGILFYVFMKIMPGAGAIKRRLNDLTIQTEAYMRQDEDTLQALRLSKPANANQAY